VVAGQSAARESARLSEIARHADDIARDAREASRRYAAASSSEKRLALTLAALEPRGYRVLSDRRWPGSARAQVDFIVVGPSGVWIVDAKSWRDVRIERGRVFRGQADVTDDFGPIAQLAATTESALAELGFAPGEVHALAAFTGKRGITARVSGVDIVCEPDVVSHIVRRGTRLSPTLVAAAAEVIDAHFPEYGFDSMPVELTIPDPVMADVEPHEATPLSEAEVRDALMNGILAQPIEDWMAFLHPDQARLVRRSFNGPSRIRGAAGTGKTVVGLHRAAYLARSRPGTVLVTAYVRTLPDVLRGLVHRLAPEIGDEIEFAGVHAFAVRLLRMRGVPVTLDADQAQFVFARVWAQLGARGVLAAIDQRMDYWKDEIAHVIKGRGLTGFEQYAALARVGRRRALSVEQRREVWRLHVAYNAALRGRRIHDFEDVILLALASLRRTPLEGYSSVIVDEVQDLSCAMVQMLHCLVGDASDGLTLIGDGQQSIYPGGFTLAEAGVSIAGRGVVMSTNYRNTVEISEFAAGLVRGDDVADIEGLRVEDAATVVRHGSLPTIARFASRTGHDASLVAQVRRILRETDAGLGDIAVLALTHYAVRDAGRALAAAGYPTVDLAEYAGKPADAIKIGTIKRSKGLEFAHVLVARTPRDLLDGSASSVPDVERRQLARRELYVAMTRARDGLWVGVA